MTPKEAAALWNPRRAPKSVRVVSYTTFSISCLWRPNIKSTSGDFWRTPGYSPRPTALFIIYKWLTYQTTCNHQLGRDPFNQNSDRSDREKTRFFETFPVGPNRSVEFWTEISGNFGWMDRAPRLFANDALLNGIVTSDVDCDLLQSDLCRLESGQYHWQMEFNPSKCKIVTIWHKTNVFFGVELEQVDTSSSGRSSRTEREMLAVVWPAEHFHLYVYGAQFSIITDHKPLIGIFSNRKQAPARFERWKLRLCPMTAS